jgi:hypothetical protein
MVKPELLAIRLIRNLWNHNFSLLIQNNRNYILILLEIFSTCNLSKRNVVAKRD